MCIQCIHYTATLVSAVSAYKHNVSAIKEQLSGQWTGILSSLCPGLVKACENAGKHVPCPVHGGIDGFRLFKDADTHGMGICNTCHERPLDGIGLLMWANGWTLPEALQAVSGEADSTSVRTNARPQTRPMQHSVDYDSRRRIAERQWGESSEEPHAAALLYYGSRGLLNVERSKSIRYHSRMPYFEDGRALRDVNGQWVTWPCIVAMMRSESGNCGLLKIYLTSNGRKPSRLPSSKVLFKFGELRGAAVRVDAATDELAICEGLETALAVKDLYGLPVAACGTAALMQNVDIPARVKRLFICADKDVNGVGERSALALKDKLNGRDMDVEVLLPESGDGLSGADFLDVLIRDRFYTS